MKAALGRGYQNVCVCVCVIVVILFHFVNPWTFINLNLLPKEEEKNSQLIILFKMHFKCAKMRWISAYNLLNARLDWFL